MVAGKTGNLIVVASTKAFRKLYFYINKIPNKVLYELNYFQTFKITTYFYWDKVEKGS